MQPNHRRMVEVARLAGRSVILMLAVVIVSAAGEMPVTAAPQQDAKSSKSGTAANAKAPQPKVKRGLHINKPEALQGYTLVSPIMSSTTYLIDMQGRVVRTWKSESTGTLSSYLLENGNLLRHGRLGQQAFGDGPGAAGQIQEFAWDGELVWDFKVASPQQLSHHDICRMPNGNVLVIAWEKKSGDEAVAAGRRPETVGKGQLLPDCILEVQPTGKTSGKVVWEWHSWDHLIQDHDPTKANYGNVGEHPELIDINFGDGALASIVAKKEELEKLRAIGYVGSSTTGGKPAPVQPDWMHSNAVAYNPDLDQILLSSYEFNEIWIIDHSTTTAEAASHRGGRSGKGGDLLYRWGNPRAYRAGTVKDQKLFNQHNVHWIPRGYPGEGHLLAFNNGKRRPGGAHSSVDEIVTPVDPQGRYAYTPGKAYGPEAPIWSYSAPKKPDFYAEFISGAHRLPNGNTHICAGPSGTIFEVTPQKEIVWKYVNPAAPDFPPAAGGPPRLVEIVPGFLRETLGVTAEQAKQLDQLQKETELGLDTLLTAEQKKRLHEPPSGPVMGGPPAPGGHTQPVHILAGPLQQKAKVTAEQKKRLETLQKSAESKVEAALTGEQRKQLKDIRSGFINAWRGGGGGPRIDNAVFRSYRYAANYPGLAGKNLTPGKTIEELQAKAQPVK